MSYLEPDVLRFLEKEPLTTTTYSAGQSLWRIHGRHCVIDNRSFDTADRVPHEIIHWSDSGRFGSADCQVLYLGLTKEGAFYETMCSNPSLGTTISRARLAEYACSEFELPCDLTLVDFSSKKLLKNRLDSNVFAATDTDSAYRRTYRFSRAVGKAVFSNPANYDGLIFPSRVNPDNINVAIFYRTERLYRKMQEHIVMAMQTLDKEPWVYGLDPDLF